MSNSPKLSGDTIAYLETLAKLDSLSSHEHHFDFSSYYQARLDSHSSRPYLSIPAAFLYPVAAEGLDTSAKNNGRMEAEGQEESMMGGKLSSEIGKSQESSTNSTQRTSSKTQQLLFSDEATCYYDHINQDQDYNSESVSPNGAFEGRRRYMADENGAQVFDGRIQHEQDSDDHTSELTHQQTTSEEDNEEQEKGLIAKKTEEKQEKNASRQNFYHNRLRFLPKELGFLLETNQEKFMKMFEEKLRLNRIPESDKDRYLEYCKKERERFNILFKTQCEIALFWIEDDGINAETIRGYLLKIIDARKEGKTKGQKSKCEALISTENDVKKYFNPCKTDSVELAQKKRGARLAIGIFFKYKFYEHWVSEVCGRLERSNSVHTAPMKRLLTKKKNSIYHLFVPNEIMDSSAYWD